MAKTIKTSEVKRDIKTRPANPHLGVQMKRAALKTKDAAVKQLDTPQGSPNEYASDAVEEKAKSAAQETVQALDHRGRRAVRQTTRNTQQLSQRRAAKKEAEAAAASDVSAVGDAPAASGVADAETPVQNAVPDKSQSQQRKTQQKKKNAQRRGRAKAEKNAGKPSSSESGKPNRPKRKTKNAKPKQKPGRSIGRSKKSAKTVQQGTRQAQQAAKTAAKSAQTAKQTAQRSKQAAQQSVKAAKATAKATYKAIKAAIEGTKMLVSAIIAGGWVAVVIILVICLAGFLIASPFGIFFSGGDGEQSLQQVVQTLSREYYDRFDLLQHNYVHNVLAFEGGTMSIDWPQVLAVYAVKVTSDPLDPAEVISFDDKKVDQLRKILNEMNSFTYSVKNLQTNDGIERTLTIHIAQASAASMAQKYRFNAEEKAQLDELLSGDYADLWAQLLGGYVPGSGEILQSDAVWQGTGIFTWPLQEGYRLTSQFGMRDNPTSPGSAKFHNGVDLAVAAGTPILAAADGVVETANSTDSWGSGWGFFVRLQHENGYTTLYAHCSKIGVRQGETVRQGQVIAWVGSTGNSIGPHLHFEVRKNGVVLNPMDFFAVK